MATFSRTRPEDLQQVTCSVLARWIRNSHTPFAEVCWGLVPSKLTTFLMLLLQRTRRAGQTRPENLHCGHNNKTIHFLKSHQGGNQIPLLQLTLIKISKKQLLSKGNNIIWTRFWFPYLLSFWVIVPFSSLPAMEPKTLLASFAKSKSRTSAGETGTIAKASLSSFTGEVPIWNPEKLYQQTQRQEQSSASHTQWQWNWKATLCLGSMGPLLKPSSENTTTVQAQSCSQTKGTAGERAKCCCSQWKKHPPPDGCCGVEAEQCN